LTRGTYSPGLFYIIVRNQRYQEPSKFRGRQERFTFNLLSSIFTQEKIDNIINAQQEFAKRKRDHAVWWKPDMQLERNILDASIDEFKCKRL